MNLWIGIFVAAALVYSWKIFGYLLPVKLLEKPKITRTVATLTVSLLSALFGLQAVISGNQIQFDARIPALIVAGLLLIIRAPFIVVVAVAAAVAALVRAFF